MFMISAPSKAENLLRYGQYLARECFGCHRIDGTDNGIPSIIAWEPKKFIKTLREYKREKRPNPTMQMIAKSIDEKQMKALALYFSQIPKYKKNFEIFPK